MLSLISEDDDDDIPILAAVATYIRHGLLRCQTLYENILPEGPEGVKWELIFACF